MSSSNTIDSLAQTQKKEVCTNCQRNFQYLPIVVAPVIFVYLALACLDWLAVASLENVANNMNKISNRNNNKIDTIASSCYDAYVSKFSNGIANNDIIPWLLHALCVFSLFL